MKKTGVFSQSLTAFVTLSVLASAAFVACAKPSGNKAGQVRSKNVGTKNAKDAKQVFSDDEVRRMGFNLQNLEKNKPFDGVFQIDIESLESKEVDESRMKVHCVSGLDEIGNIEGHSDLVLLGKSSMSLINTPDSSVKNAYLFSLLKCEQPQNLIKDDHFLKGQSDIAKEVIEVGQNLSMKIVVQNFQAKKKIVHTQFSCVDHLEDAPFRTSSGKGIILKRGSSVLVTASGSQAGAASLSDDLQGTEAATENAPAQTAADSTTPAAAVQTPTQGAGSLSNPPAAPAESSSLKSGESDSGKKPESGDESKKSEPTELTGVSGSPSAAIVQNTDRLPSAQAVAKVQKESLVLIQCK